MAMNNTNLPYVTVIGTGTNPEDAARVDFSLSASGIQVSEADITNALLAFLAELPGVGSVAASYYTVAQEPIGGEV